jgi:hypothetical protein
MYYIVNVDQNAMAAHLTISDCEEFYKVNGTLWYVVKW